MRFYLIYLTCTDGDCATLGFPNIKELNDWVGQKKLHVNDYAVIKGKMLKHFTDSRTNIHK